LKGKELFTGLKVFFDLFHENSKAASTLWSGLQDNDFSLHGLATEHIDHIQAVYDSAFQQIEKEAAGSGFREDLLLLQRRLYLELENIYTLLPQDPRHNLFVVIPVADRPLMLKNCVRSLVEQAGLFGYGGRLAGAEGVAFYNKVRLCIVDDSSGKSNIADIKATAEEARAAGIRTDYIGLEEQTEIMRLVPSGFREQLSSLIGDHKGPAAAHKGASITRNIAYLYLLSRFEKSGEKNLVYFMDSDEEFRIKIPAGASAREIPFINYFYWIDRLFTCTDIDILTGKVVGDPPVSPAVMINTFLDDLALSLEAMFEHGGDEQCCFHEFQPAGAFSAEYHDMVKLFGYNAPSAPKKFRCGLAGPHKLKDCLEELSQRTLGFFYGDHPTRTQFYDHAEGFLRTDEARTVYTGNYVFNSRGFRHFIPFAGLKFRMAGPALGRILRRKLGSRFVSVNLPLLHRRTSGKGGNEFRSGLVEDNGTIDLSGEYLRQFWGDVMLFSIEGLAGLGYPDRCVDFSLITETVREVRDRIYALYREKQASVTGKISKISALLADQENWWNACGEARGALNNFSLFCSAAEKNFGDGSTAMKKIAEQISEDRHTGIIINAIESFYEDDFLWNELLDTEQFAPNVYQNTSACFESE